MRTRGKGVPSTTFPIITRWFLIHIAYNIRNVVKTDKFLRTNGGALQSPASRQYGNTAIWHRARYGSGDMAQGMHQQGMHQHVVCTSNNRSI